MNLLQQRNRPNNNNVPTRKTGLGSKATLPTSALAMGRKSETLGTVLKRLQQIENEQLYPRLALLEGLSGFKDKSEPRAQTDDTV